MPKTIEDILNETLAPEMKQALQEAFDAKLVEMRAEIEETVSAEIANRYEHDKSELVEAMDQMLTDVVRVHEEAKASEIAKLAESRRQYNTVISESAQKLKARVAALTEQSSTLINETLEAEVRALRDQKVAIAEEAATLSEGVENVKTTLVENHEKHLAKINEFVTRQLTRELSEFAQDKRALVETRVKLISENKAKIAETQSRFIKEAAAKVEDTINETLTREMTQLHEDIERNRKNNFGEQLFEAFAATFYSSHLAEGTEVRKLQKVLESKQAEIAANAAQVAEANQKLTEAAKRIEMAERKVVLTEASAARNKIMGELLSGLRGDKRSVMESMLETTKTAGLKTAFDKLLPVVLAEGDRKAAPAKTVLSETKAAPAITTGDRQVRAEAPTDTDNSIAEILHLAGVRKL